MEGINEPRDLLYHRLLFDLHKEMQSDHHNWKERTKVTKKYKIWLWNVVKWGKYTLEKFANFVYFCITHGNYYQI